MKVSDVFADNPDDTFDVLSDKKAQLVNTRLHELSIISHQLIALARKVNHWHVPKHAEKESDIIIKFGEYVSDPNMIIRLRDTPENRMYFNKLNHLEDERQKLTNLMKRAA